MKGEWTSEQELLASTLEDFAKQELEPDASALDEKEGFNRAAFQKMAGLGLLGITVPESYGGAGLGCVEATLAMEKMGAACASSTLSYLAHSILCVNNLSENASDAQKKKYLPKLISGEWIGAMAMTEPGAGSDALGLRTKAERKGDSYVLNGSKTFITNGPEASVFVVYAKTGSTKKDISTFIVEKGFPGFKVGRKLSKLGMRASPTSELSFENCVVPLANRVGEENHSVSHMMRNLNIERITISGISLGIARACVEYAANYAKERKQFDQTIGSFQMVQERLAEMATNAAAARALVYQAARAYDSGDRDLSLGAMSKLFSAQIATRAGLDAVQILGGYGYMKEYPVERYLRDAKLMEIGAGTNEIMRVLIARELLEGDV
ncbi:acyl-CoA dehydrogenase family protein [bacterium]|nr:acyl-CoA dehydrogenase family protein [bacterium]